MDAGVDIPAEGDTNIDCSFFLGSMFGSTWGRHIEIAWTRFVTADYILDTSTPYTRRDYFIGPYCTQVTTPPDWSPPSPPIYFITADPPGVPTGIVDGRTLCFRAGTSGAWTCLPAGQFLGSYDAPYFLGNYTHNQ